MSNASTRSKLFTITRHNGRGSIALDCAHVHWLVATAQATVNNVSVIAERIDEDEAIAESRRLRSRLGGKGSIFVFDPEGDVVASYGSMERNA